MSIFRADEDWLKRHKAKTATYAVQRTGDMPISRFVTGIFPILTDTVPLAMAGFGLVLPYPPTANTYVRHTTTGRHYMTAEGKRFRRAVISAMTRSKAKKVEGRLEVLIVLCPKDRKRGDLDNRVKPLLDAMQHAKCFDNDEQVDRLEVRRDWTAKTGDCFVTVREYKV